MVSEGCVINSADIESAVSTLRQGRLIAYPTEAVYGLGCDPFNWDAVASLLRLKKRSVGRGFILVAAHWGQIESLIEPIPPGALLRVFSSWPGPYTWVFPASSQVPDWIRGHHLSVAVRVSAHPIVQALCHRYDGPIISTSANTENQTPLRDYRAVQMSFERQVDFIVPGKVGNLSKPTSIQDAVTGHLLRGAA